jgi:hypothetical protein
LLDTDEKRRSTGWLWYIVTSNVSGGMSMAEPFDEYVDQFLMTIGPYGATIGLLRTDPQPASPGTSPQAQRIGTIRMSLEHLKVMTYILKRQITLAEAQLGVSIQTPLMLLNNLQIAPEDWEQFWKKQA